MVDGDFLRPHQLTADSRFYAESMLTLQNTLVIGIEAVVMWVLFDSKILAKPNVNGAQAKNNNNAVSDNIIEVVSAKCICSQL